jgi:hypothetical protein
MKVLSGQAKHVWSDPKNVQRYYELAFQATDKQLPDLGRLNVDKTQEYQRWTPFADVWDVRAPPPLPSAPLLARTTSCMHAAARMAQAGCRARPMHTHVAHTHVAVRSVCSTKAPCLEKEPSARRASRARAGPDCRAPCWTRSAGGAQQ